MYHFVCPAKYRRVIFDDSVEKILKETCLELEKRFELRFLEIGSDDDHVHFLIQSVPTMSPSQIVQIVKSATSREIRKKCPEVKNILWGGHLWTDGYFVNTVSNHANEEVISQYVRNQGRSKEYKQFYRIPKDKNQSSLFDFLD